MDFPLELFRGFYEFILDPIAWLYAILETAPMWQKCLAVFSVTTLAGPMTVLAIGLAVAAGLMPLWPAILIYSMALLVKDSGTFALVYFGAKSSKNKIGRWVRSKQFLRNRLAECLKAARHKWVRLIFGEPFFAKFFAVKTLPVIPYSAIGFLTYGILHGRDNRLIFGTLFCGQVLSSPILFWAAMRPEMRSALGWASSKAWILIVIIVAGFGFSWFRKRGYLTRTRLPA